MGKKWSILCILAGTILIFFGTRGYIEPNLDEISKLKAKSLVTEIIGNAVRDAFPDTEAPEDYFVIKKDQKGNLRLIQADTAMMNRKIYDLTVALQETYGEIEPQKTEVPFGAVFGSPILSQMERGIPIRVMPLSVSSCDFETAFESQGINQTKYQIFVCIETEVRVLQPFSDTNFRMTTRMLLAELVIVGDVPENYVSVPEEDILDVT